MSFVTIVMATYNGQEFLNQQIQSLLKQDYPFLEFIFVDDFSIDSSFHILTKFAALDPRIKVFRNLKNLGINKTFEFGIQQAKGDFIALSDQDDVWDLNKISILMNSIGSSSLIYSDSHLIDAQGNKLTQYSQQNFLCDYPSPLFYTFGTKAMGHAMLFKKEILSIALPFPDFLGHDFSLGFAAACMNGVKYFPYPLVQYRQHANNAVSANLSKAKKNRPSREIQKNNIIKRINFLADRSPNLTEKSIFKKLFHSFSHNSLKARFQRFFLVFPHRKSMLTYKGKTKLGEFLYCFKLFYSIY
ncbi:MAG: putative glycosyltransferase [Bacteroidota bacterium]